MKLNQILLRSYFQVISTVAPAFAAKKAFELFQTAQTRVRKEEADFFEQARHFQVHSPYEPVDVYEMGNPEGKIVFLVHGWNSNSGSMAAIGRELAGLGFRVISFNLPAHGTSKLKKVNLVISACTFISVIDYLKPSEPFSVVSHSFGSAVTTYALSTMNYKVDKLAFLSTPDRIFDILNDFRNSISLGDAAFDKMLQLAEALLGEPAENVNIHDKIKWVNYNELLLIHDLFDKVLAHRNSLNVHKSAKRSRLATLIKVGHYRMLWDEKVLNQLTHYFSEQEELYVRAS